MLTVRNYRRAFIAVALVPLLASCAATPPAAPPPVTVTVAPPAEAPAEPAASEAELTEPAPAEEPEPAPAEEPEQTFVMPDVAGVNLQLAQDTLQSLGSWVMDQEDASGLDRMQLNDSNWRVCQQDPAAGSVLPVSSVVTLWSVKLDEACP